MTLEEMFREKMASINNSILVSIDTNGVAVDVAMRVFDFYIDDDGWYFVEDESDNAIHFKVENWKYCEEYDVYIIKCCDDSFITVQV